MTYAEIILHEIYHGRNTIRAISESQRTMMLHDIRSAIARMLYAGQIVTTARGKYAIPDDRPVRRQLKAMRKQIKLRVERLIKNECGVGFSLDSGCSLTKLADNVSGLMADTEVKNG